MPLDNTTRRYDLREERDRLDDKLDELAAQSVEHEQRFADLQGRAATGDGDEPDDDLQRELGQLMDDREDLQQEIGRANRQYNGVVWALDRYGGGAGGEQAMADGGAREKREEKVRVSETSDEDPRDDDTDADEGKQELYEQMTGDGDEAAEQPADNGPDVSPQAAREAANRPQEATGPAQSADSPAAGGQQQASEPAQSPGESTAATEAVTITLGGLTAGEHARVTDRAGDAQAEKSRTVVGSGQQGGSVEGASRVFYCAAGLVDAPFLDRGASFEAKCEAVREIHPGLMIWIESRIDDVNTPSENLGRGWEDRLDHARNSQNQSNGTSPPDTNT